MFMADKRGSFWQRSWRPSSQSPAARQQQSDPADMGTAFGLDATFDLHLIRTHHVGEPVGGQSAQWAVGDLSFAASRLPKKKRPERPLFVYRLQDLFTWG
jgi:hypothetical protein